MMASGAVKRFTQSAMDWSRFAAVCPAAQMEMLRTMKTKHDAFVNKVHSLPENLPKIDFMGYKTRLPDPSMADRFQKAYEALNIPYPKDKDNLMKKVEAENEDMNKQVKAFTEEIQADIKECNTFLSKIDTLPAFEDMTAEMFNYYFPETAFDPKRPTFFPHVEEEQPYNPEFKYYK